MTYNDLTPEESRIIQDKGTERPFSGEYDDFWQDGVYLCRQCDAPLYHSGSKFNAGCGWPSFDEEIDGAVIRTPDADGARTEISCANCGGHLGHVFTGEKHTPKDTRHCVNSLSMRFIPLDFRPGELGTIVLGGGCFWCVEAAYKTARGIVSAISGYAGGHQADPTYEEVCAGHTGHAEVVRLEFDPQIIIFEDLLKIFFTIHDPTTLDQQGNDIGTQYRSIILYSTCRQREQALRYIAHEQEKYSDPIVTETKPLIRFYPAEDYHQDYFRKNPDQAYCQAVIRPKLEKLAKD